MTNADRIRAMTDEELADYICYRENCSHCEYNNKGICESPIKNKPCKAFILYWLKQEVDNAD